MTNSLEMVIENFSEIGDNKRRILVSRLKQKKKRIQLELKQIDIILEKYAKLKKERLKIRAEKISALWRDVE